MKKFLLFVAISFALLPVSPAKAHDPIILTSDQQTPATGPLLIDGTISFALYGSLTAAGETRGFRVNFKQGDQLYFSLLIPDLEPENELDDESMPYLSVQDPNGSEVTFTINQKYSFNEPFTNTNYLRLLETNGAALNGTYSVTITGKSPARFTVSVGEKELFGTPVENILNRELGVAGVMNWYSDTAPQESAQLPATLIPNPSNVSSNDDLQAGVDSTKDLWLFLISILAVLSMTGFMLVKRRKQ